MALFVRETGRRGDPAVVLLHGGYLSGWSWAPVVERLSDYRCLVPDLPQYGGSVDAGPFDIDGAAAAIVEVIGSRTAGGHAHIVGFSLGAQVAAQVLASAPEAVDRAVLCGPVVNTMPGARVTSRIVGLVAANAWLGSLLGRRRLARQDGVPAGAAEDYRADARATGGRAGVAMASAGFTVPAGLAAANVPTLLLTGGNESPLARRWAAAIADPLPNAVQRIATGMDHDWPLHRPELFARTVAAWLSGRALPPEII